MRSENTLRPRALAWLRNWVWVMMWTAILTSLPAGFGLDWSSWTPAVVFVVGVAAFFLTAVDAFRRRRVLAFMPLTRWVFGLDMWKAIEHRPLPRRMTDEGVPFMPDHHRPRRRLRRIRSWRAPALGDLVVSDITRDEGLCRVERVVGLRPNDVIEWSAGLHVICFGDEMWVIETILQPLSSSEARPADVEMPSGTRGLASLLPDGSVGRSEDGRPWIVPLGERAHALAETLRTGYQGRFSDRTVLAVGVAIGSESDTAPARLAPGGVLLPGGVPVWTESEAIHELTKRRREVGVVTSLDREFLNHGR